MTSCVTTRVLQKLKIPNIFTKELHYNKFQNLVEIGDD